MTVFIEKSDDGVAYDLATVECIGSLVRWNDHVCGFRCLRANEESPSMTIIRGGTRIWYLSDPQSTVISSKRTKEELVAFREDLIQRWAAARKERYAGAST